MSQRLIAPITAALLLVVGLALASIERADARGGAAVPPIDPFDRAAVAQTWNEHVDANMTVHHQWNGNVAACRAGAAATTYDGATLETINWFRAMVGLGPVRNDTSLANGAQQAALMMHAAGSLSHYPSSNWPCHSAAGATAAASSNLTLGVAGARGVIGQIEDPGASNEALGHRRWLLYPPLVEVGIGNTSRASAISLFGDFGPRPGGDRWIAWPPPGYVPHDAVFDRWSLSFSGERQADFTRARVEMSVNGRSVPVRILPNADGFGDNTLGFEPQGLPATTADVRYSVTVSGIVIGDRVVDRTWELVAFDPTNVTVSVPQAPPETCMGRVATIVGTPGDDRIQGTTGDDVIVALTGDDVILASGGDDIICAGGGDDLVRGGRGHDVITGGPGRDRLRGGPGGDTLMGEGGRDRLVGEEGNDTLIGGLLKDALVGGKAVDTCIADTATTSSAIAEIFSGCEGVRR